MGYILSDADQSAIRERDELRARLDAVERERDEATRLLREVREIMWDEEPLCAEIHAFLAGDTRDRTAVDDADPRWEQWS